MGFVSESSYYFITHWRVNGTCEEVADLFEAVEELPRWWPSVYKMARVTNRGGEHCLGQRVSLWTRGRLPYTLRWDFVVTEQHYPYGCILEASGDFVGRGEWVFVQDGDDVEITYFWDVRVEKPLLRVLTPLLRRIFAANHRWAMAQGERSLQRELERRRAPAPAVVFE